MLSFYNSITTRAVFRVVFSIKFESHACRGTSFFNCWLPLLSCLTAAEHLLTFQRLQGMKNTPCGPAQFCYNHC